ncbi:hypothetical protein H7U12_13110 [Rufibacter sp. H-1]|uniref:Uncharacterized protein n=1 Tax=Rufibacter sediminis TaxID=2762756 RepID=A0ABR6VTZ4_9BACT|nr:hypothetical protein [Rufibacter sediminis]
MHHPGSQQATQTPKKKDEGIMTTDIIVKILWAAGAITAFGLVFLLYLACKEWKTP